MAESGKESRHRSVRMRSNELLACLMHGNQLFSGLTKRNQWLERMYKPQSQLASCKQTFWIWPAPPNDWCSLNVSSSPVWAPKESWIQVLTGDSPVSYAVDGCFSFSSTIQGSLLLRWTEGQCRQSLHQPLPLPPSQLKTTKGLLKSIVHSDIKRPA
jgi:hypothetical protein